MTVNESSGQLLSTAQSFPSLPIPSSNSQTISSNQQAVPVTIGTSSSGTNNLTNLNSSNSLRSGLAHQGLDVSLTSTASSESDGDLLENCHQARMLADLEDEEELPDAEDENEDDENENEDDDDLYDQEMMEDEVYEMRNGHVPVGHGHHSHGKRRSWDDEYVLKRQFTALIPAFDPRPGRTNINQISDLNIPPPGTDDKKNNGKL